MTSILTYVRALDKQYYLTQHTPISPLLTHEAFPSPSPLFSSPPILALYEGGTPPMSTTDTPPPTPFWDDSQGQWSATRRGMPARSDWKQQPGNRWSRDLSPTERQFSPAKMRPFRRPGESSEDRAEGIGMAPPSAWSSVAAYQKALRAYDQAQAFLAVQGGAQTDGSRWHSPEQPRSPSRAGVDPAIAAAQEHQFHQGFVSGTISQYKAAKVAQLAEEARMRPSDSSQLRKQATLLISGGQTPQTWNAIPELVKPGEQMQTRAAHLAAEEAANASVEAFYQKMAQAASRKAGRAVSVEEIRTFVPSLSGQQLSYVTSNAPVDVALAGPGSGKSTATRAKVLYDILVNGADPKEYVFTSKTHSANRNFVDAFSADASSGRRDVSELVPGWTRAVREKQTQTLDYMTRKHLHSEFIHSEEHGILSPIQVLQMAAQTEKGRHLLAQEGLSDFQSGAQPLYQKPVGRQSFIDDDMEQAQKSLSSFIAKAMKQQGIEQKSYDLAETTHYVIDSKQKRMMGGSFQDRMTRGKALFEQFDQGGRKVPPMGQVDPDLALYVTQQAMSGRPGFSVPEQKSAHYDLSDEGHMLAAALRIARKVPSMQVRTPLKRLVSDEFQDADPNHVQALKELVGNDSHVRMSFSGDMGQMAVRRSYPIDQQVMEAFGSVGVQKHVFTGNYRAGAYGVALSNAINTLSVMQNQPQSPMQVSMRPMGQTDLPPKMYLGPTYGTVHRKMVKDWLKNTGVTLGDIGQAMEEGRHPFAHLEGQNVPSRNPFVFQTDNVQKSFRGTLKQMLAKEMGPALAEQFMRQYVLPEKVLPDSSHALMMQPLKINAIRGRDAERAYLDVGQAGMWDVAGYADNLRVMTSRAKQQNRLYASMDTLPGTTPHDMTPSQFQGEAVAPGFDVLLQVMSELTHHQQNVPLQQMPGWMARSAASPTQMTYAREGGAGPVQDAALMEQYASEVFALNRHYQPEVGAGSGVMSLDEVGREAVYGTAGGEGDDATAMDQMNTFSSLNNLLGRNKNGVDRTQLNLVHSFMRQLLTQGPSGSDFGELPEDTSSLISFFQQQFGRVSTPHADEQMGGPLPRTEEFFGKTEGLGYGTLKVLSGDPHAMVRADDLASIMAARYQEYAPLARPEDDPDRAGRASTGEDGGQLVYADEVRTRGGLADLLKYTQHDPMVADQMQQTLHHMGKQYMGPLAEDELGKFAFKMPLSPSFVREVTNAADVYANDPSHHEGFRQFLRKQTSSVREQYGTHDDLFTPITLSQEHLDRMGRVDPFHAAVTRALLQDGSLFLPKHEYSRLEAGDQGFLKGLMGKGLMQYDRKGGQLAMSAAQYSSLAGSGGEGSDVRKRVYSLMRSNLYDVGAANAYGETVMHPEVRKRLNQFEYLPGAVMRTLSPQEGARMRIPVHQMRNAPAITRLTSYLSLMSKGMGTNETGGIIDPQAIIAHPQGGFQSLGAGMSLPQYEARLRDQMKRMGPQFLKTKWGTHLADQYDQVRSMRQSFSSPQNLNRYAHALRVVLRATTGEDVQGEYKNRESLDPIRRFFAPAVGHARSVGQVMNVHQSLERAASHLEEHGSLRRSHVDDILTAFGHDSQNKQFTALRHLENAVLFKPTKQNANPSLSLEALIESFHPEGRDRNNLVAQLTRTPFLPGVSYQFMGGQEGFGEVAGAQKHHGGIQAGMVGRLESFDEKTSFGLSKNAPVWLKAHMFSQTELELHNDERKRLQALVAAGRLPESHLKAFEQRDMPPLFQFVSPGGEGQEAMRFPVRADQLRLAPHELAHAGSHASLSSLDWPLQGWLPLSEGAHAASQDFVPIFSPLPPRGEKRASGWGQAISQGQGHEGRNVTLEQALAQARDRYTQGVQAGQARGRTFKAERFHQSAAQSEARAADRALRSRQVRLLMHQDPLPGSFGERLQDPRPHYSLYWAQAQGNRHAYQNRVLTDQAHLKLGSWMSRMFGYNKQPWTPEEEAALLSQEQQRAQHQQGAVSPSSSSRKHSQEQEQAEGGSAPSFAGRLSASSVSPTPTPTHSDSAEEVARRRALQRSSMYLQVEDLMDAGHLHTNIVGAVQAGSIPPEALNAFYLHHFPHWQGRSRVVDTAPQGQEGLSYLEEMASLSHQGALERATDLGLPPSEYLPDVSLMRATYPPVQAQQEAALLSQEQQRAQHQQGAVSPSSSSRKQEQAEGGIAPSRAGRLLRGAGPIGRLALPPARGFTMVPPEHLLPEQIPLGPTIIPLGGGGAKRLLLPEHVAGARWNPDDEPTEKRAVVRRHALPGSERSPVALPAQDLLAMMRQSGPLPRSVSGPLGKMVDASVGSGAREMARLIEAPHQVLGGMGGSGGGGNLPPAPPISPPPPPPPPSSGGPSFSNASPLSDLASLGTLLRTQHEIQVGGVTVHPPTTEQRHILDTQAQHMLIEGGPGAGKTLTVGTKIADMIARGEMFPEEITAMSATRSGAQELTKRFGWVGGLLHQIPGLSRDSRYKMPHASTFHGLAYRTLFGNQFPTDPSQNAAQFSPLMQAMGLGQFKQSKGVLTNVPAEDISWMTPNELKMMGTLHSQGDFFKEAVEPYLAARKGQVGGSQAKLLNAVLRGGRGRDKALEALGVIKRGTIEDYQAAQVLGKQHVSQGVISHEALLHLYEQRQHAQGMPDFDDVMNFAGVAIQQANAGHISKELLPDFLSQQRLFTVDEGQDLFHNQARLLKGMMEHSRGIGGDPRLLVGFDRGQALFPGLGGLENPVGVYSNVVGEGQHPLSPMTLRGNLRGDQASVALNNAILSMPQMRNEPGKSPMQFPLSPDRGSDPSFLMRHSQSSLYQTAFRSMLKHAGVSFDEMRTNVASSKDTNPFEGIDWHAPGRVLPSEIPMIFSMRTQQQAFAKQAQHVLQQELGLSDTQASEALHHIYRQGAPTDRMNTSEQAKAQHQFWGMRVAGARSQQFLFPHMDVTRVGQWLDDKNSVSYLKNMFTGLSRVSRGGQNIVLATDHPYQHMSVEQEGKNAFETYGGKPVPAMFGQLMGLANEQLASFGPSPSATAAPPPPAPGNAPSLSSSLPPLSHPSFVSPLSTPSSQGGPLPLSGKELDYAKQQAGPMLMEWIDKMGGIRKRQGGDGWASPIAKELQEQADASYRAFQIKPQGRAAYDAVRDWTALRDYHKQSPGASLGLGLTPPQWPTGGKHDLLPFLHAYRDHMPGSESNDIIGDLPPLSAGVAGGGRSGRSGATPTPTSPPKVEITAQNVAVSGSNPIVNVTSTSSPSLGGGGGGGHTALPSGASPLPISAGPSSSPSGGGGGPLPSRWKYSPWNVGGGGGGSATPPPTPSMPIIGTGGGGGSGGGGGTGGSGDEENAASTGTARSGGRSSSGGGGGSGSSFNNVASNFGRTLARIGYEMQFVGKLFNQITQQAVDQGSSYRRATLGLSGSGQDGTSGFFSFENGGPIDTFQQQNLPMYSKVQLAQQMKSIAAASGTQQGLMGTTQDVLSLAAISGVDPSELIGQTTSISGTLGAAGQTSQISQQLMGGLTSMYGTTLGPENVSPTLAAVSQVLPTMQGLSMPNGVNSQLSPTLALFQSALAGGMTPGNFGEVSSAIGGLAQMGSMPDLGQQYVLSQLFGEQRLTANPQLQEYQRQQLSEQQNLAELSLQQNVNGQGLSLPKLQMQIGQADIQMEKANLDMSALQYSHDVASFQFQQQQQTAEYGPIGADVSRNSYFDFMRQQMQAGYNPLSAETGTTFKSNPTFGLQNAEFYAGVEHQRTMLTLGRSPLLNDAAYQEQMKYLNEQEAFYHEQLQLQNAQRQFEKDWTQKLLDQQGVLLDLQKKRYGLDVVMNAYQQKMLGIQDKYLPLMAASLSALIAAQNQFLQGQGPVNGQNVTPDQILTRLSGLPDDKMKSLVSASRLPLDQQNALEKMIEGIDRSGGIAKLEASQNPNDKKLLAQAQNMIKQGAFADQTSQASVADAFLNFAGKGGTWQNFVTAFDQANQHWKDIGQGLSDLNSAMKGIGTSLTILGPLAVAIGTIANGLGFAQSIPGLASLLGKGKPPALPGTGTGTGSSLEPDYTDPARYTPVEETPMKVPGIGFMGAGMYPDAPTVPMKTRVVQGKTQYSTNGGQTWQNDTNFVDTARGAVGNFFSQTIPSWWQEFVPQQQKGGSGGASFGRASSPSRSPYAKAAQGSHLAGGFLSPEQDKAVTSGIGTFFSKTLPQWFSDHIGGPFNTFIGTTLPKWFSDHIGGPFNTFVFTTLPKWWTDHIAGPFMTWIAGVPKWMNDHIGTPFLSWVGTLPKFFMDHIGTPFMGFVTGLPKWFMDHIGTPFMTGVITPLMNLVTKTIPDGFTTLFTKTIPDLFTKTIPTAFTDTLKNVFGLGGGSGSSSSSQNGGNNFLSTLFTSIFGGAPKGGGGSVASFASASHPGFDTPRITTEFGQNTGHGPHQGVDFAVPQGTPTKEFIGGRVTYAGWQPWGGEVDVQIPGGMLERYLHLSALGVTKGQLVPRDGFLGLSGGGTPQSGLGVWSTGPHSHVQIDHGDMLAASNPWPIWAAFGATDISAFYGGSAAMMKQSQTSESRSGGGGTPLHHLSTGGIALSHIRTSLGESGPEAVIPLSRIGSVLRSVQQQQGGGTTDTATAAGGGSNARAVTIGHLIGTLNLTVGSGSGGSTMSDNEKDELLCDLMEILSTAAKRFVDQVQ